MGAHSGHWAMLLGDLWEATGEPQYRTDVRNIASYITYHLQPDNRICVGPTWPEEKSGFWYSIQFSCTGQLMKSFGYFPELVPRGKTICCAVRPRCNRSAMSPSRSSIRPTQKVWTC